VDSDTGELIEAYIFVAALPYSGYAYAEAFLRQNQEAWITAHVNAFEYFGGVTRILVPDNLKTGVIKNTKTDLVLNRTYQELAEHYGMAIIPTRVRKPKDKATVEGSVGIVSTFILAAIRNQKFFTLRELNEVVLERLQTLNHKSFQKKDTGAVQHCFPKSAPLFYPCPETPMKWRPGKPRRYRSTTTSRLMDGFTRRRMSTSNARWTFVLPATWSRFFTMGIEFAPTSALGTQKRNTLQKMLICHPITSSMYNGTAIVSLVVESILTGYKVENQGYRSCMALLKLSDSYTPERLEAACDKALSYTPRPSCKSVQAILKSGLDKPEPPEPAPPSKHGFTRGAGYYGKGGKK
jgi:hypothetical protein